MKLIIDIPDEVYEDIDNYAKFPTHITPILRDVVKKGVPVNTEGEWILTDKLWEDNLSGGMGYDYGYYFACSRCKYEVKDKTKFCPDCGLYMRGKKLNEK